MNSSKPFQAEFISDTHMNMWKYSTAEAMPLFPGTCPILILAGDIGDPDEPTLYRILEMVVQRYKTVIYVPGNHEFYKRETGSKKTPASVLAWFKTLEEKWNNFHFFYRRTEVINGIRIIGATGWSTSPKETEWAHTISEEGKKDRDYIEQQLARSKEPCLVITHYPPSLRVLQSDLPSLRSGRGIPVARVVAVFGARVLKLCSTSLQLYGMPGRKTVRPYVPPAA